MIVPLFLFLCPLHHPPKMITQKYGLKKTGKNYRFPGSLLSAIHAYDCTFSFGVERPEAKPQKQ
jgi:hypothetical protein